ncbi:MAG: diphosphate--fructose-6-phosphate 1-phosphotransferase [Chlamydiales bacterium]|nr:diphosphate--fructose-6-phosphate 1-phosphotransferase [Chlamydiales bacterium]
MQAESPLQLVRRAQKQRLPKIFESLEGLTATPEEGSGFESSLEGLFPYTAGQSKLAFSRDVSLTSRQPLRIGVVLSGGQAAGGHNVIIGLFDALKRLNKESTLYGFLNGPGGIVKGAYKELEAEQLDLYRNTGGFDLIGSGRTKIETDEQFEAAQQSVKKLQLDGLVVIGGDDSNTNAALLAEYFRAHNCPCNVVGVPKTIDGDLRSKEIEVPFGFDTACKTFSETIGNIARDALSAKKYWHFIRLMGRSASHITLECALQTHPNLALIGEEIAAKGMTLAQVTDAIADAVVKRAENGKNYGVILIPEGIIEFIPECQKLIKELNSLMASDLSGSEVSSQLSPEALNCFQAMPKEIQSQLLLDRDPHGNVQVSKIETERLFIATVEQALQGREIKFNPQPHFLGYEGRAGSPSQFDADYCYALGFTAALLLDAGMTCYVAFVQNLTQDVAEWKPGGAPLVRMFHLEERKGVKKPVIQKALVDLQSTAFKAFQADRELWVEGDYYRYPGPIQFFGPEHIVNSIPLTLKA